MAQALQWFAIPENLTQCTHFFTDGDLPDGHGEDVLRYLEDNQFLGKTILLTDREAEKGVYYDLHFRKSNLVMARDQFVEALISL